MKIYYKRVSSIGQSLDRQSVNDDNYDLVIEDKCSGTIPFFDRPGGKKILELVKKGNVKSLHTISIDRFGRNLRDILNSIHVMDSLGVCIHFEDQGLKTKDDDGKENYVATLMIATLGTVAQLEKSIQRERQIEGIRLAKLRSDSPYKGRLKGTTENVLQFLNKEKNTKALGLLKKGYKVCEIAKILEMSPTTVSKVKRLGA
jgi:DNA invertase Pin-like site-specific DNA recombinase